MRRTTLLAAIAACFALGGALHAGVVGDIRGIYAAPSTYDFPIAGSPTTLNQLVAFDAVAFVVENTSNAAITGAVLTIGGPGVTADSFNVGTVAANSYLSIVPGMSNDGQAGHHFFAFTNNVLDTSDTGPNGNDVQFRFTASQGGTPIDSGIFTPAATFGPSNDNLTQVNFLGGGPNSDNCNNCFGPKIIAELETISAVPEPATCVAFAAGLIALAGALLRRRAPVIA